MLTASTSVTFTVPAVSSFLDVGQLLFYSLMAFVSTSVSGLAICEVFMEVTDVVSVVIDFTVSDSVVPSSSSSPFSGFLTLGISHLNDRRLTSFCAYPIV